MKKVLVVDDTKNIRTLLTKCLQMEGYEVNTANDGKEAIAMFIRENFDLAFLDIKMPYFSGTEVLKQIRELGIEIPVIIITAYATVKNAVECTKMGTVAYLQKPFTADKIRNVLADIKISGDFIENAAVNYHKTVEELFEEKRYLEAFSCLKKILAHDPLKAETYRLFAEVCEKIGRKEDAQKYFGIYESLRR